MPTSGSLITLIKALPIYADKKFIANTFSTSFYKSLNLRDVVGSGKLFLSAINGLGDEDVRLSKRRYLSSKRLRGFQKGKVGPVDGKDHVGGNTAASINFEASLPNFYQNQLKQTLDYF